MCECVCAAGTREPADKKPRRGEGTGQCPRFGGRSEGAAGGRQPELPPGNTTAKGCGWLQGDRMLLSTRASCGHYASTVAVKQTQSHAHLQPQESLQRGQAWGWASAFWGRSTGAKSWVTANGEVRPRSQHELGLPGEAATTAAPALSLEDGAARPSTTGARFLLHPEPHGPTVLWGTEGPQEGVSAASLAPASPVWLQTAWFWLPSPSQTGHSDLCTFLSPGASTKHSLKAARKAPCFGQWSPRAALHARSRV